MRDPPEEIPEDVPVEEAIPKIYEEISSKQ